MGFRNGAYATIWEVKKGKGNYSDVRLSTSKKDKSTGQYVQDFAGFVRFVGTAHEQAARLNEKDRIKIGDCEVTNQYDREKKITYTNYAVFSFEPASGNTKEGAAKPQSKDFSNMSSTMDDEELPFN